MRTTPIAPGEIYHLIARGNMQQVLFRRKSDWTRFLFLIMYLQSPYTFRNIRRVQTYDLDSMQSSISMGIVEEIINTRYVELIAFALMPNHVHLVTLEKEEGGIARYMQRTLNAYAKYLNTKYELSGHVFQGPYRAVHVSDNEQLLHLSAYVHRNPRELPKWFGHELNYPWSSYRDYVSRNRWGELLQPDVVLDQFGNGKSYHQFVKTSSAKLLLGEDK